jgi:ATP-dependent Clp protease ATP-binding subunit ClpA
MRKQLRPDFGFETMVARKKDSAKRLESIGMNAVRRKFSPEFVNRIDAVITYQPLNAKALATIVDQQIEALEQHIVNRLMDRAFEIEVSKGARAFLLRKGTSEEYGARELKRVILRHVTQPLAAMVSTGAILPDDMVHVEESADGEGLTMTVEVA